MAASPHPVEVEDMFQAVLAGTLSREDADHWAGQWVYDADSEIKPSPIWLALNFADCDLRHGPNLPYLHSAERIAESFEDFQKAQRSNV